jgi:hypothetical protein
MKAPRQAKHLRYNVEAMRIETVTMNELRDGDVPFGCQRGEQIEALKNEADFVAAQFGARGIAQFREVIPIDQHFASGGLRQAADHVEQRRLAAPRGTHHGDRFAGQDFEIHTAQGRDLDLARAVKLPQILSSEYRLHAAFSLENQPFGEFWYCSCDCHPCLAIPLASRPFFAYLFSLTSWRVPRPFFEP